MSATSLASDLNALPAPSKRTIRSAWLGMWLDLYDIYLPIIALTPAIIYFQSSDISVAEKVLLGNLVFVLTLIGRPFGSALFGALGDVIGRKRVTEICVAGASVATLLVALLPGYETIGPLSIILLLALRAIGGVFMGGEYSGANPLAMEATPRKLRGIVGGIIQSGYPLAYVTVSVFVTVLLSILPHGGISDAYTVWGWRIPFVFGAIFGFAFLRYLHKNVEESTTWKETKQKAEATRSPLLEVMSGDNRRVLLQVFVLMTGLWFGVQALTAATPSLLTSGLGVDSQQVTNLLLVANVVLAVSYLVLGQLGQRIGRHRVLAAGGAAAVIIGAPMYYLLIRAAEQRSLWLMMLFVTTSLVAVVGVFGLVPTYLSERFPTNVRSSGYGLGYSLALMVPSGYGYYMGWLGEFMNYALTPIVFIVVGGVLTTVGALLGPDTRGVVLEYSAAFAEASPSDEDEPSAHRNPVA